MTLTCLACAHPHADPTCTAQAGTNVQATCPKCNRTMAHKAGHSGPIGLVRQSRDPMSQFFFPGRKP